MTDFAAYVVGEECAGYRIPDAFTPKDVKGLRMVQVLRHDGTDVVVAAFDDSATACLRRPEVAAALRLTGLPRAVVVADERKAKGSWWPATVFAKAERVVAVGGIVLALVNYGSLLFAAPDYTVRAPDSQNVLAGAPAEFKVDVFNRGDDSTRFEVDTPFPASVTPPMFTLESRTDQEVSVRTSNGITA